ncbi:MAG TPA: VOC family protein, partial [Candidatus Sulfotelmatobacter sp.]|nr:VOC family protein [Candidatus Sulfotelmatobacter sp.]
MSAVRAIPEGYHSLTPSLVCKGAARAIEFYKEAFNAKEIHRMAGPGDKIGHAELQIGDSRLMLSDEFPGMATAPGSTPITSSAIMLYTDNVDAVFERAVKAGAK